MKYFLNPNVIYLEETEFSGNRIYTQKQKQNGSPYFRDMTIVMVQGVFCGYCTQAKGVFQKLADDMTPMGIDFATIQIDGERAGERVFKDGNMLSAVLGRPMGGVPLFAKFMGGGVVNVYEGPRDYQSLRAWIES